MIVAFIDEHKQLWGIEPICRILTEEFDLKVAPQTYYAFKTRGPSARAQRDAQLKEEIMTIHAHRRKRVYGIRKIHAELNRTHHAPGGQIYWPYMGSFTGHQRVILLATSG